MPLKAPTDKAADKRFAILLEPLSAADGGGYLASVPDLPGCMSDGETQEEALANVRDAIACWIEAANELERPIPDPMPRYAAA